MLEELADGRHPFAEVLKKAEAADADPGAGRAARSRRRARCWRSPASSPRAAAWCKDGWNGFNVLHTAAARVGGLELGFVPGEGGRDLAGILAGAGKGEIEVVYLLGADEIDTAQLGKAFVIYQGHHGDRGAHRADVILPGAAYTEKDAHLREHRGPRAAGAARGLPAGRCARGLGDPPRAVGRRWASRCPMTICASCAGASIDVGPALPAARDA